jgi:hypothetical protein
MIDNKLFTFTLNENEKFIIKLEDNFESIDHYSGCKIIFHRDNQSYQIDGDGASTINIFLITLRKLLKKSLCGDLLLHHSINVDIGYQSNQKINDSSFTAFKYTDQNNDTYWIGQKYELSSYNYTAWIYNDDQNNIIFEVTPEYPRCIDQENEIEVEDYQNWMKSYKPLLITIIPHETAQKWLKQAETILEKISKNME